MGLKPMSALCLSFQSDAVPAELSHPLTWTISSILCLPVTHMEENGSVLQVKWYWQSEQSLS